jgi:Tfp pilus assembly major pilin PilA
VLTEVMRDVNAAAPEISAPTRRDVDTILMLMDEYNEENENKYEDEENEPRCSQLAYDVSRQMVTGQYACDTNEDDGEDDEALLPRHMCGFDYRGELPA